MEEIRLLTLQQVAQKFGYATSSFKAAFSRTAAAIKNKYGVRVIKVTMQEDNRKQVLYRVLTDDNCDCMYDQPNKTLGLDTKALSLEDYEFLCLLGIISYYNSEEAKPMVFCDTKKKFLNRIGLAAAKKNIQGLENALHALDEKGYINFIIDDADPDYIVIYIKRAIQKQIGFNSALYKECKAIANKYHKNFKKVPQMVRVWLALQIYEESGATFKYKDISQLTGLSEAQIRDIKKMLINQGVFKIKNVGTQVTYYGEKYYQRQGQEVVWVNGFYY